MPAVFIHGVPDTYRVWKPVLGHLDRVDIVTLALPGFDSPLPNGFQATKEEYVNWIIKQLEQQSGPVDPSRTRLGVHLCRASRFSSFGSNQDLGSKKRTREQRL